MAFFVREVLGSQQNWTEEISHTSLVPATHTHNLPHSQRPPQEWHTCDSRWAYMGSGVTRSLLFMWRVTLHVARSVARTKVWLVSTTREVPPPPESSVLSLLIPPFFFFFKGISNLFKSRQNSKFDMRDRVFQAQQFCHFGCSHLYSFLLFQ